MALAISSAGDGAAGIDAFLDRRGFGGDLGCATRIGACVLRDRYGGDVAFARSILAAGVSSFRSLRSAAIVDGRNQRFDRTRDDSAAENGTRFHAQVRDVRTIRLVVDESRRIHDDAD